MMTNEEKQGFPEQKQEKQPGEEFRMNPAPEYQSKTSGKRLENKVAIITGGDSGIGRAVAVAFANEGADVAISYLDEHEDAMKTQEEVAAAGRKCLMIPGDICDEAHCNAIVEDTLRKFGKIDILVNNAAVQFVAESIKDITLEQLERTFRTNIFAQFFMVKACYDHLSAGASIINSTSVTAYKGNPQLMDYASTKGAITAFTRSLAVSLAGKGIRVNGVAPGPVWTPLIPASFDAEQVGEFGKNVPLGRAGQPNEIAPAYVFLASDESSYFTGQVLHPNGGEVVNA